MNVKKNDEFFKVSECEKYSEREREIKRVLLIIILLKKRERKFIIIIISMYIFDWLC